jgi:hypothetical protein
LLYSAGPHNLKPNLGPALAHMGSVPSCAGAAAPNNCDAGMDPAAKGTGHKFRLGNGMSSNAGACADRKDNLVFLWAAQSGPALASAGLVEVQCRAAYKVLADRNLCGSGTCLYRSGSRGLGRL